MLDRDRILTTHGGSLVRPPQLQALLKQKLEGKTVDDAELQGVIAGAVRDVVRKQAEVGVDVVSDGEFGKPISWASYINVRLAGLEHHPDQAVSDEKPPPSGDAKRFPEFWAEYQKTQHQERESVTGWVCSGPIRYAGQEELARDIANLRAAVAEVDVVDAFLPVVAPASIFGIRWQEGPYSTEEEYVFAIADALHEEYKAIIDAGFLVQVDDAFLPYMHDIMVPPASFDEYRAWAQLRVEALNHALRGLPRDRVRYHICWGSFNAPHVGDIPAKEIIDLILSVNAGYYLIEMANPRHEHEWQLWRDAELPEGTTLVPGVISHATNIVEHPELVAERLVRLAELVGPRHLMAGTDCGFAQGPFVERVHPTIQWAKLGALAEGAALANKQLSAHLTGS